MSKARTVTIRRGGKSVRISAVVAIRMAQAYHLILMQDRQYFKERLRRMISGTNDGELLRRACEDYARQQPYTERLIAESNKILDIV